MWLTRQDMPVLTAVGLIALSGLGVLGWQRQRPLLIIRGAPPIAQTAPWEPALRAARQVDINTADVAELERLPKVGPALARRIVAEREAHGPFRRSQDLSRVKGIGAKTYELLEPYVTVRSP